MTILMLGSSKCTVDQKYVKVGMSVERCPHVTHIDFYQDNLVFDNS